MRKLDPGETALISGRVNGALPAAPADPKEKLYWLSRNKVDADREVLARIHWLTGEVLALIGVEKTGGWEKLYRDPADGRYWLLTYPFGELQAGGPPSLICRKLGEAEIKAGYLSPAEWDEHMEKFMRERNIRVVSSKDSTEESK